jgi:arginine/ornithine transport system substrate-binding protein
MTVRSVRRILAAAFGWLMAFGAVSASAEALRYCNEADFPPFSYKTAAGAVEGFDVDVANYICNNVGMECEIVVQEWTGIIPALAAGKCDAIISSMTINDERKQQVLFSEPYYDSVYAMVARKDLKLSIDKESLKGKTFCMFKNSTGTKWLEQNFGDVIEIKFYDGAEAIKTDLVAGRCQAWLETMPSIYGTLISKPEGKDFEFVGKPMTDPQWFGQGVGIAVRMGENELITKINTALNAMYADGTFKKINDKYFPFYLGRDQ